jgi:hypothetical protein
MSATGASAAPAARASNASTGARARGLAAGSYVAGAAATAAAAAAGREPEGVGAYGAAEAERGLGERVAARARAALPHGASPHGQARGAGGLRLVPASGGAAQEEGSPWAALPPQDEEPISPKPPPSPCSPKLGVQFGEQHSGEHLARPGGAAAPHGEAWQHHGFSVGSAVSGFSVSLPSPADVMAQWARSRLSSGETAWGAKISALKDEARLADAQVSMPEALVA